MDLTTREPQVERRRSPEPSDLSVLAFLKLGALCLTCFGGTYLALSNKTESQLRELELRMDSKYATKGEILASGSSRVDKTVYELEQKIVRDENDRQQKQIDRLEQMCDGYRSRIDALERRHP